jgi:hypothetical protein
MRCPTLAELPSAQTKQGWPWTEESPQLPERMPDGSAWPRISVVTPSFNQAACLEETIRSVLLQGYPNLEYLVIDGGSSDSSPEILAKYAPWLAYHVSEPDRGQYDGIQKGFDKTAGAVMAWLNSDDRYCPGAFRTVGEVFALMPDVEWLTSLQPRCWDAHSRPLRCPPVDGYSRESFWRGEFLPDGLYHRCIQQESTFWRRTLWSRSGGRLDAALQLAGDFELWTRFAKHAELYGVGAELAGFRLHGDQKTGRCLRQYVEEAHGLLVDRGGRPHGLAGVLKRRLFPINWFGTHSLFGVGRLPARLARALLNCSPRAQSLLTALGFIYFAPIVLRTDTGWRVTRVAV